MNLKQFLNPSVDSILKSLTNLTTQLQEVAEANNKKREANNSVIDKLLLANKMHINETNRAMKVKANLEKLIEA